MDIPSWGKFLPKQNLVNHLSDAVEVGMGRYGPSLGLAGSLSTETNFIFVQNISIELDYNGSQSPHHFIWFAFRPYEFTYKGITESEFLMPAKFMITPAQAYRYNILFIDQDKYGEIKPLAKLIRQEWEQWLKRFTPTEEVKNQRESFQRFLQDQYTGQFIDKLAKLSYWDAGDYSLTLKTLTDHPKKLLEIHKHFRLAEKDIDDLQQNVLMIILDLCNQPGAQYHTLSLRLN